MAILAILDLNTKVGFGLILTSAKEQTLAQASDPINMSETANAYMAGKKVLDLKYRQCWHASV